MLSNVAKAGQFGGIHEPAHIAQRSTQKATSGSAQGASADAFARGKSSQAAFRAFQGAPASRPAPKPASNSFRPYQLSRLEEADLAHVAEQSAGVLQRPLTTKEVAAIQAAHAHGLGDTGKDGEHPAAVGNYAKKHISEKARILQKAGLTYDEIRALMTAGVVGFNQTDAAHYAIATDLFNGKVIEATPFSANDNKTKLFKIKVHNEQTGRTRDALFKPRSYGDGEGWDRSPIEYVTYELNRMLGMDYVPPAAYRHNIDVAFQNYAEGVVLYMVPDAHLLRKVNPNDWGAQKDVLLSDTRILDVLIQNSDRHHGNFLRGKHWVNGEYKPVLIDHAAGFRKGAHVTMEHDNAFMTGAVKVVRRSTLENLKKLNFDWLKKAFHEFLSDGEIWAVLGRRDGIVKYFEERIAKHGEKNVVIG